MKAFKSLAQLFDYFDTQEKCVAYLEQERWKDSPACPHCGSANPYRTNRGFKCSDKDCYKKFTVTVGTIFHDTKLPLRTWFAAIFLATNHKKGISSHQLASDLQIPQKTAWFMLHRIREMLRDKEPALLDGEIEVDETYIGGLEKNKHRQGKKGNLGRGADKAPVVAVVQRNGAARAFHVPNVSGYNLTEKVFNSVEQGARVMTDSFTGYYMLRSRYTHQSVNHSKDEFIRGSVHTNTVEGFFSLMKRGIYGIYHQVSKKHLQSYCDEFSFRYSMRKIEPSERFDTALKQCNTRLPWKALVNKKPNS